MRRVVAERTCSAWPQGRAWELGLWSQIFAKAKHEHIHGGKSSWRKRSAHSPCVWCCTSPNRFRYVMRLLRLWFVRLSLNITKCNSNFERYSHRYFLQCHEGNLARLRMPNNEMEWLRVFAVVRECFAQWKQSSPTASLELYDCMVTATRKNELTGQQ